MENLEFGRRLIEVRKAKGLTQEEVAEKCKITTRTIQRIESGVVKPRAFTIKLISESLGFDFYDNSDTGYSIIMNQNSDLGKHTFIWYAKDLFNLKTHAMKKISILTASFFMVGVTLFLFISKVQAQPDNKNVYKSIVTQYNGDKSIKRIEVRFSNYLTFDSLAFIKNDLKAKGIIVDYSQINFDEKGNLIEIFCHVKSSLSGNGGSFGTRFQNSVNKDKKMGFFYDFSKEAKSPFCCGSCGL